MERTQNGNRARLRWDPLLTWVFVAALLARWAASWLVSGELLARTWEYEQIALNLINGNGFVAPYRGTSYYALVHPFYPAFCAAVYWLVGHSSLLAVQLVQAAAVIPAGWTASQLAFEIAGRKAGLLAALGVTLHPALLLFSLRRHALWLDSVIFLAILWATFRTRSFAGTRQVVGLGALFGLGLLCRSTISVFMVVACLWLVWQWREPLRVSLPRAAIIVGVAFLVAAPWLVRNALVFRQPMGFLSTTGYGLWIGNNPSATGGALAADGSAMDSTDAAFAASIEGLSELEQQAAYRKAAFSYVSGHPAETALNYIRKLRSFLFWSEQTGAWYPAWFRAAYQAFYLLLLACAAWAATRLVRTGKTAAVVLCSSLVLSVGIVQSLFFVEGRHRWEVESALVVLAACGIGRDETVDG